MQNTAFGMKKLFFVCLMPFLLTPSLFMEARCEDNDDAIRQIYNRYVDSLKVCLHYKYESVELLLDYKNNADIVKFVDSIKVMDRDTSYAVWRILIRTISSMEYSSAQNRRICDDRASMVKEYLLSELSAKYSVILETKLTKRDWVELERLVVGADVPMKDDVLNIIRTTPEFRMEGDRMIEVRKPEIVALDGGRPWKYILENLCPQMVNVEIVCMVEKEIEKGAAEPISVK